MDSNTDDNSLLVRYSRSMSLDPDDYGSSPTAKTSSSTFGWSNNKKRMFRTTSLAILFGLLGWYYPRHLIANETSIVTKQPPYQQTEAGDIILDLTLNQPLVDPPTIPGPFLVMTSVWVPFTLIVLYNWFVYQKTSFYWIEMTTAISALSTSIGLCEGTTQLLKLFVQRKRPNYYALCGFDKALKECTADIKQIKEANFSFPSGHSSLACGGMTFLVLFFIGKASQSKSHNHNHSLGKIVIAFVPWGWSLFVAASRLVDTWHHPSDVVAGLGLGFSTVTIMYHAWYPPVWSMFAGVPRLVLQELDYGSSAGAGGSGNIDKLPTFSD